MATHTPSAPHVAPEARVDGPSADRSWRTIAGFVGLIVVACWPTVLSFGPTWSTSYQEHGFFLAALAVGLIWRDRRRTADAATEPIPELSAAVAIVSVGWLLAVIMDVRTVHQLGLIAMLGVWAFTVLGRGARVHIVTVFAVLALAVPVWGFLRPALQRATTLASGAVTQLAGIQAEIGYYSVTISSGTFLVEEGCSGMNFLMGGLTLGAFYGQLFTRRWQTQLKIVGVAGLAAIVGNWIRVTVLIFLGEATQMQSPLIEDHVWQGWAIFTVLMIPTYFVARRIELADGRRAAAEAVPEPAGGAAPGLSASRLRVARLATGAALLGPGLYLLVGAIPRSGAPEHDASVFQLDPEWSVVPGSAEAAWTPDFHGFDERADWSVRIEDRTVQLARFYYVDQRQGEELIQYNNAVASRDALVSARVFGPVTPGGPIVQEAILFADEEPRIVWYWYRVAGFDTPFPANAKLLEIVAFFRRSATAELVTMSAACSPDDCRDAARALLASMAGPEALSDEAG